MNERNKTLIVDNKEVEVYKYQDDAIVAIVNYAKATPNGHTLVTAPNLGTLQMYVKAQIVDLLVEEESITNNFAYHIDLKNGHRITLCPITREGCITNLSLTSFCMVGFRIEDVFLMKKIISQFNSKITNNHLSIIVQEEDKTKENEKDIIVSCYTPEEQRIAEEKELEEWSNSYEKVEKKQTTVLERMYTEMKELRVKMDGLNTFTHTPIFKKLSEKQQELMLEQYKYMRAYHGVLNERIDLYEEENK